MAKPHIPRAHQAEPGMLVRQQALDIPSQASDHVITEVSYAEQQPGNSRTGYYLITTNYGNWTFYPDELVTFPRRPDSSTRDWRGANPAPLPLDLAIGDLLPPRAVPPDGTPTTTLDQMAQRVTAVTRNRSRPKIVQVTTYSKWDKALTTAFLPDEPVIYPRPIADRPLSYEAQSSPDAFGPYLDPGSSQLHYLITHPKGRGRWPRWIAAPIPLGPNTYLAKPPGSRDPWPPFVGTAANKWRRHPADPAWGEDPIAQVPADQLKDAERAYADYRKRAEPVP